MATKPSEQHRRAWRALFRAQRVLLDLLEGELAAGTSLPLASYEVLAHLNDAPEGRLRLSELADALVLSRSGVTRLVDRLERGGFVRRETCPSDRRGAYATLTDAGRETLRTATPLHLRGIQDHFASHLSTSEATALAETLERLAASNAGP